MLIGGMVGNKVEQQFHIALMNSFQHSVKIRHHAEHRMIDCLAQILWEAQSSNQPPDEKQYLENLRRLAG